MAEDGTKTKLIRALAVTADAITLARRRTADAAAAAEAVDGIIEQQLIDIYRDLQQVTKAIDELQADLAGPPTGE